MTAFGTIYIARHRAHALQLLPHVARGDVVWTAKTLFEHVAALSFLAGAPGVLNDDAVSMLCTKLACEWGIAPSGALDLLRARGALINADIAPQQAIDALLKQSHTEPSARLLFHLKFLHALRQELETQGLVDFSQALRRSLLLVEGGLLPPMLKRFASIKWVHLFDLAQTEFEVALALAKHMPHSTFQLPADNVQLGLSSPAQFIASQIEARDDLLNVDVEFVPLVSENKLCVQTLASPMQEAAFGAAQIAQSRAQYPRYKFAIALRSIDDTAKLIVDACEKLQVPVHMRRGEALQHTPLWGLIALLMQAKEQDLPREVLLSIVAYPNFEQRVVDAAVRGDVEEALRNAAAYRDAEDVHNNTGAYLARLQRYAASMHAQTAAQMRAQVAMTAVQHVVEKLSKIPAHATLQQWLECFCELARTSAKIVDGDHVLAQWLAKQLSLAQQITSRKEKEIDAPSFMRWCVSHLNELRAKAASSDDADAVDVVQLSELFDLQYDVVWMPQFAHGAIPKAPPQDNILRDEDRILLNRALGRNALRLYDDDPLNPSPVPPRMALEPLLFAGAMRAAREQIWLTRARFGGEGREREPSAFLAQIVQPLVQQQLLHRANWPGQELTSLAVLQHKAPDDVRAKWQAMRDARDAFFADGKTSAHAFDFTEKFADKFAARLGLQNDRYLSPTRIEALASCRFRAALERFLDCDFNAAPGQDLEVRALGRFAHAVLEEFYQERMRTHTKPEKLTSSDRAHLRELIRVRGKELLREATGHQGMLRAQLKWLETALIRAVSMHAGEPPVRGVAPVAFEAEYKNVPMQIGEHTIHLGGIIDRVDQGVHATVVVDYKTSTAASVREKVAHSAMLQSHFQLPIYLRLLHHNGKIPEQHAMAGYLISLREGVASQVVGMDHTQDIRDKVCDDTHPDGLHAQLEKLLLPVLEGKVTADVDAGCDTCRLVRVCRVPKAGVQ